MQRLRDVDWNEFNWPVNLAGDLDTIEGGESFRGLVNRWLLTMPSEDMTGLTDEEIEQRRRFADQAARDSDYDIPEGDRMTACLPWDPAWGLGVKRFIGRAMTPEALAEIETRVRTGLPRLQGVRRVASVVVSALGDILRIAWSIESDWGPASDILEIN